MNVVLTKAEVEDLLGYTDGDTDVAALKTARAKLAHALEHGVPPFDADTGLEAQAVEAVVQIRNVARTLDKAPTWSAPQMVKVVATLDRAAERLHRLVQMGDGEARRAARLNERLQAIQVALLAGRTSFQRLQELHDRPSVVVQNADLSDALEAWDAVWDAFRRPAETRFPGVG